MTNYIVYGIFREIVLSGSTTLIEPIGVATTSDKFAAIALARPLIVGDKRRPVDLVAAVYAPGFMENKYMKDRTGHLNRRLN